MMIDLTNELPTVMENPHYLNIGRRTVYRYLQDRRLPGFKLGKEWRVTRTDLEQWLEPGCIPDP
jgi:excisionase family DNA binding protein